ncbi:MAG: Gfo/Idh/MocA family oxidoreductase [Treponemataceae bacterium]
MVEKVPESESKIVFGIYGSGWRAGTYLRIAKELPKVFEVCGLVTRSKEKGTELEREWGIKTFRTVDDLVRKTSPRFIVVSVSKEEAPDIIADTAARGIAVLAETPPATSLEKLLTLYNRTKGAKIQIAEQYYLQPQHAARLSFAGSGKLGEIHQTQVSFSHGYHAMSLIRKTLGVGFENAAIRGFITSSPMIEGPGRNGLAEKESLIDAKQDFAFLDFNGKLGLYDFAKDQHRSWARFQRILLRGSRGEILNSDVKYLKDFRTPIELSFRRVNAGENGNLEGCYLKGILAEEEWIYKNPFVPGRLSDDEIAVASCLNKMNAFIDGGPSFYSLAEASQDQYLAFMTEKAFQSGERIVTQTQPWAEEVPS